MRLVIEDLFDFPSLKNSELVAGEASLKNPVTAALVMEALDIESWGQPGQLLLTSFYAFRAASPEKMDRFFFKARERGIAGFIFKTERLVDEVPTPFFANCVKYGLPLIIIPKTTPYTTIVNEILAAITSKNALLLKSYYDNHQHFIRLMMEQADFTQILETLEELIRLPVSLVEQTKDQWFGAHRRYFHLKKINELPLEQGFSKNISGQKFTVTYPKVPGQDQVLSFPIPNLGYQEYELIVHQVDDSVTALHLMAIENAIVAFQIELVNRYMISQKAFSQINDLAAELVFGRLKTKEAREHALHTLGLDVSKEYRMALFHFHPAETETSPHDQERWIHVLSNLSKVYFPDSLFVKQPRKLILLVSAADYSLQTTEEHLEEVVANFQNQVAAPDFIAQITISRPVAVDQFSTAYKQASEMQTIRDLWDSDNGIIAYEEIGIFQLLIETESLAALEHFVPQVIWDLAETNPDLLKTLYTFINSNQNYTATAKNLFVHPKTVHYRIDQLADQYQIDFQNTEKMLQYNIAIRIVLFLQQKE